MSDEIVGHKTFHREDGSTYHEPLTKSEADVLLAAVEKSEQRRAELMPDEQSAIRMLCDAYQRLHDFGWRSAMYAPKDGQHFESIEAGSTGIGECFYMKNDFPTGSFWSPEAGDLWPSRPVLFRCKTKERKEVGDIVQKMQKSL